MREELKRIRSLEEDLSAETLVPEEGHSEWQDPGVGHGDEARHFDPYVWVVDVPEHMIPNTTKRETARTELNSMLQDSNEPQILKYVATRALGMKADTKFGYYPTRIFIHEHPIVTTLATAGIAYGLYQLVEFFSK